MTTIASPDCTRCKHLDRGDPNATKNTCKAFPEGIPDAIFFGGRRHLKPYPGDRGIRFEAISDTAPAAL